MPTFLQLALPAFLAASHVAAQEVLADVPVWNGKSCGEDGNDPDLRGTTITVFADAEIEKMADREDSCYSMSFSSDDWGKADGGYYNAYVDQSAIPDDCQLVVYSDVPEDSGNSANGCFTFLRAIPQDDKCGAFTLLPKFNYAMCCGKDACEVALSEAFTGTPAQPSQSASAKKVRDVTEVKRAPALQKRKECTYKIKDDAKAESYIWYGDQEQASPEVECGTQECTDGVTVSYSGSASTSFTAGADMGVNLFEVISASVSFSQTYTKEKSKSFSSQYTASRPPHSKGYVTFTPKYECAPDGSFEGDCDWNTDESGWACFPQFVGELPNGIVTFVQTN